MKCFESTKIQTFTFKQLPEFSPIDPAAGPRSHTAACELSFLDLILVRLVTPVVKASTSELGATGWGSLRCVLANCHLGNYILFTFDIFSDFKSGSNSTSFLVVKWCCCWAVMVYFRRGLPLNSGGGKRCLFIICKWLLCALDCREVSLCVCGCICSCTYVYI